MLMRSDFGCQRSDLGVPGVQAINLGTVVAATPLVHGSKAALIILKVTHVGAVTLTATPTIERGAFDGQQLYLHDDNDSTNNLTIQDRGTLANSGLALVAATVALGPLDYLGFTWDEETGLWVQDYARLNVL